MGTRALRVMVAILALGCEGTLSGGSNSPVPSTRDADAPALDASSAADARPPDDDAAAPAPDGGPDADSGTLDGGPAPVDAGSGPLDAGSGPLDAGSGPLDAGRDAGSPCDGVTCRVNERCEPSTGMCVCVPGTTPTGSGCTSSGDDPTTRTAAQMCERWTAARAFGARGAWTAGADACANGTLSRAGIDSTVARVNVYRWLVGLGPVVDDPTQHADDQACAVMMTRNGRLDHAPPTTWTCYSEAGARGAGRSNLALGISDPPAAIDLYMDDRGVTSLGHRRWVLNGPLGRVGIGFAGNAQCLGVFDRSASSSRTWTAWPNPGPTPREVVPSMWSFHSNTLTPSAATVSVVRVRDGATLAVTVSYPPPNYGPDTVAFSPSGWTAQAGETYRITIGNVSGGPITYDVVPTDC